MREFLTEQSLFLYLYLIFNECLSFALLERSRLCWITIMEGGQE